jgi:hypothetical protein
MRIDFEITGGLSVHFQVRFCCTDHYVSALLKDLDELAWNNVREKIALLDLHRSFLVQFRFMGSQWRRRNRTQLVVVVSIIRGPARPACMQCKCRP